MMASVRSSSCQKYKKCFESNCLNIIKEIVTEMFITFFSAIISWLTVIVNLSWAETFIFTLTHYNKVVINFDTSSNYLFIVFYVRPTNVLIVTYFCNSKIAILYMTQVTYNCLHIYHNFTFVKVFKVFFVTVKKLKRVFVWKCMKDTPKTELKTSNFYWEAVADWFKKIYFLIYLLSCS